MEYQYRRYRIAPGRMADWVEGWSSHVAPLRQQTGFTIEAAWVLEEVNEFVWVLGYSGPEGFAAADAAYYESPQRAGIEPDPAQLIESIEHLTARRV